MIDLEKLRKELDEKFECAVLSNTIERIVGEGYRILCYMVNDQTTLSINGADFKPLPLEKIRKVILALPQTEMSEVRSAMGKIANVPYILEIQNNACGSSILSIKYINDSRQIRIDGTVDFLTDFTHQSERKLTSSEIEVYSNAYNYQSFGCDAKRPCLVWNGKSISFESSHSIVLLDKREIKKVIDKIFGV